MSSNQNPLPVTTGRRLVRCVRCGQSVECTNAGLLKYTRSGWPRCCGDVMSYYIEADPPTAMPADDTKVNRLPT